MDIEILEVIEQFKGIASEKTHGLYIIDINNNKYKVVRNGKEVYQLSYCVDKPRLDIFKKGVAEQVIKKIEESVDNE